MQDMQEMLDMKGMSKMFVVSIFLWDVEERMQSSQLIAISNKFHHISNKTGHGLTGGQTMQQLNN